jgi:lysophospholipase L1-like esterase
MKTGAMCLRIGLLLAAFTACAGPAGGQPFPVAKVVCFGDSITAGVGASAERYRYANLIARENGWVLANKARSGGQLADMISAVYSEVVEADGNYLILTGYNDMRNFGTDNAGLSQYRGALLAVLAWLSIPDSDKIKASGDRVAFEGAWSASSAPGGIGKYSGRRGDRAVFTVPGSVIYIGATGLWNGTGKFSVTVDGEEKGVYSSSVSRTPASGLPVTAFLVRLSGLSDGPHTVAVTVVSEAGNVYFDWAAGTSVAGRSGPKVFAGNALRMRREAYLLGAPHWNSGSDEAVSAINAVIREVCRDLAGDGRNVACVDASAEFDPNSADVGPDLVHPSDRGMETIAAAFLRRMRQANP